MHEEIKGTVDRRLATIEGHVKALRKMVAEDTECEKILTQLSAVESSINSVGKLYLKHHLNHCVKEGIENGDADILDKFTKVLEKYL